MSAKAPADTRFWHERKDGKYSVQSGYRLLLIESMNYGPSSSSILMVLEKWLRVNEKLSHKSGQSIQFMYLLIHCFF
jgi:hypothetical protein